MNSSWDGSITTRRCQLCPIQGQRVTGSRKIGAGAARLKPHQELTVVLGEEREEPVVVKVRTST
jgi:hypothetical protein